MVRRLGDGTIMQWRLESDSNKKAPSKVGAETLDIFTPDKIERKVHYRHG